MFEALIDKTMEVYVDDMLVKSEQIADHVFDLGEMFGVLKNYQMKLNPFKCAFGVGSRKFLGFMVNKRGIEANLEKIKALLNMRLPERKKEVQNLNNKVATLSHFISKATNKCALFLKLLKKTRDFEWTKKCESAFIQLKNTWGELRFSSNLRMERS